MRHRPLLISLVVLALALGACATALPPAAQVVDLRAVVGTYHGSMKEYGLTPRPARVTINPDNTFEITTGGPEGARTTGVIAVHTDGTLAYQTGQAKGRANVYEGGNRRVIVFQRDDGKVTTTVDKNLP